jgi:vitamin B12 transporter
MKKSIRLRARACMPALSVLSLAVAASVQAQGIEINPVVVSATRLEQPLSDVLSSVSVITRQDIEKSQAPTLADLLQGEAGFEFGRNGGPGATTSFFLRGEESKSVVIMVDGVRTQTDGIGALTSTDMPLSQIERIEILRGNAGALYGESAIGGVINIYTKRGKGAPSAYGALTYGSRHTSDVSAGYGGRVDDYSFDVNVGRAGSNGFSAMAPQASANRVNPDKDGFLREYAAGKFEKKLSSDLTLGLRVDAKFTQSDYDGSYSPDTTATTHRFETRSDLVGFYATQVMSDNWVSRFDVSGSNFTYEDAKNGSTLATGLYQGHQDAVRWFNTYQATTTTVLNFGLDKTMESYSQRATYDMKRDALGYFLGSTTKLDRWTFQTNVRRDEVDVNRTTSSSAKSNTTQATSLLLGAGYQLNPQWRLTSTTSTGFRAPTASEVAYNPALTPETHQSQELGFVYASEQSLMRVIYFQTSTSDAIIYQSASPNYMNVGSIENKGVEATLRTRWMGNQIKLSAVSQDPWNVSSAKPLARRARQYGSADVSRTISGYDVGVRLYAADARRNLESDANILAGYSLWSFYASRKIDNEWTARVKLENAFDREYQLAYGYNTPGRGVYFTLQYQPK